MHLIFYGRDGAAAKAMAVEIRKRKTGANVRHARMFDGTPEPCERVHLMPDVGELDASRIRAVYGQKVEGEADDLGTLRAEYERLVGRKPFGGWKAATLRKRIAEARDDA